MRTEYKYSVREWCCSLDIYIFFRFLSRVIRYKLKLDLVGCNVNKKRTYQTEIPFTIYTEK